MFKNTLTKFEKVKVIGIRAEQISLGAPPCVDIENLTEPLEIAEKEFKEHKIPIIIIRKFPNGKIVQLPVSEMNY